MTDKTEVTEIPINKIRPAPWQPRETFEKEAIKTLGESLKEKGIIQPIVVRRNKTGDGYQIIAGERRWRAWEYTGKTTIPAVIKDVDDFTAKELSFIENRQREDLTVNEIEKSVYDMWIEGFKLGRYTSYADMRRQTGEPDEVISGIVKAFSEKNSLKNAKRLTPDIIDKATYTDFSITRPLENNPEARAELLKIRVEDPDKLKKAEARTVSKAISEAPQQTGIWYIANVLPENKRHQRHNRNVYYTHISGKRSHFKREFSPCTSGSKYSIEINGTIW